MVRAIGPSTTERGGCSHIEAVETVKKPAHARAPANRSNLRRHAVLQLLTEHCAQSNTPRTGHPWSPRRKKASALAIRYLGDAFHRILITKRIADLRKLLVIRSDKGEAIEKPSSMPTEILHHASPVLHQQGHEIQPWGHLIRMPIGLDESARRQSVANLNQMLADTITLRDLYKKHHWQVSGHTFYQLHLLFDKHAGEQGELVDAIAERIQVLGGVSVAMAADVAEMTLHPAPADRPRGGAGADLPAAGGARDRSQGAATMAAAGGRRGRRRDQRPAGQRRDADQRAAGLVRRRARGRYPAGAGGIAIGFFVCSTTT